MGDKDSLSTAKEQEIMRMVKKDTSPENEWALSTIQERRTGAGLRSG